MAESECCGCKGVGNIGIEGVFVDVAVAFGQWDQVVVLHVFLPQQDGQELVQGDVLVFGIQDAASLLQL